MATGGAIGNRLPFSKQPNSKSKVDSTHKGVAAAMVLVVGGGWSGWLLGEMEGRGVVTAEGGRGGDSIAVVTG